jgi:LysR family glycine cleavage system transcriptional activator
MAVDIAIRYGDGPYPGIDVTPLLSDICAPVLNPILR